LEREDVRFRSGDEECAAWLYRPEGGSGDAPCVVLAHGFAGVREARLDAYAERFAEAGYAALVFDYRHFGGSGGEPRQLVHIARQLDDWRAALSFARGLEDIDATRLVAWGTSYSGGHVVTLAAEGQRLAAVVAQTPFTDGIATLRSLGPAHNLRLTGAALRDVAAGALGRGTRPIAVVAAPGETAAMTSPDALPGYLALFPEGYEWPNEFVPRMTLNLPWYRPVRKAASVRVPLLVQVMTDDVITPPEPARETARRAPRGELAEYHPGGHFDIYVGEPFERAVGDQIAFLNRNV
jgi:pimeloyl-ACP methyl ester carboxylesterase